MRFQCALPYGFDMPRSCTSTSALCPSSRPSCYSISSRPPVLPFNPAAWYSTWILVLNPVLATRSLHASPAILPSSSHDSLFVMHTCMTSLNGHGRFHCTAHLWFFFAYYPNGLCVLPSLHHVTSGSHGYFAHLTLFDLQRVECHCLSLGLRLACLYMTQVNFPSPLSACLLLDTTIHYACS